MAGPIALVAGLGNPGSKYDQTRHNAGFWFVDRVAARDGAQLRAESRFQGDAAELQVGANKVRLLKPTTFMNRSGQSIAALMRFFKLTPEQLLVVHDELDLPAGVVRLKFGGGPGGHNGLKDIIAHLGDKNFHRLRIGIGHPGQRQQVLNYVLNRPQASEQPLIDECIDDAMRFFDDMAKGDFERAMNSLHQRKASPETAKAD
jgi:peptidyl-tRNA hydrolase, PTH1 family